MPIQAGQPIKASEVNAAFDAKENLSNKVTSITSSSTNTQYPSAKLMYDQLATKQNKIAAGTANDIVAYSGTAGALNTLTRQTTVRAAASASDTALPTEKAVSSALSGKENTITAGATSQYWRGDKTWQTLPAAPSISSLTQSSNLFDSAVTLKSGYTKTGEGDNYLYKIGHIVLFSASIAGNYSGIPTSMVPDSITINSGYRPSSFVYLAAAVGYEMPIPTAAHVGSNGRIEIYRQLDETVAAWVSGMWYTSS